MNTKSIVSETLKSKVLQHPVFLLPLLQDNNTVGTDTLDKEPGCLPLWSDPDKVDGAMG